jgi:hypothetical protein
MFLSDLANAMPLKSQFSNALEIRNKENPAPAGNVYFGKYSQIGTKG